MEKDFKPSLLIPILSIVNDEGIHRFNRELMRKELERQMDEEEMQQRVAGIEIRKGK